MDALQEIADAQLETARDTVARGENWNPSLILIKEGKLSLVVIAQSNDPMGAGIVMIHRELPDMYCFASEAWMKHMPKGTDVSRLHRGVATSAPDRLEVFMQVFCKRNGKMSSRMYTIDRINKVLTPMEPFEGLKTRLPTTW